MKHLPITWIMRHRRENLKKCSLRDLETSLDLSFFTYPQQLPPPSPTPILLTLDAPLLSLHDRGPPLLLIDGTWRLASLMERHLPSQCIPRSLPPFWKTAYPRRQTGCSDPSRGLASVEALFVAYLILGHSPLHLLEHYHWKELFLQKNDLPIQNLLPR